MEQSDNSYHHRTPDKPKHGYHIVALSLFCPFFHRAGLCFHWARGGRRKKRKGKREKERRERGEDSKLRFRAHAMLTFLMTSSFHLDTVIGQMPLQWGKAQEHVFPVVQRHLYFNQQCHLRHHCSHPCHLSANLSSCLLAIGA